MSDPVTNAAIEASKDNPLLMVIIIMITSGLTLATTWLREVFQWQRRKNGTSLEAVEEKIEEAEETIHTVNGKVHAMEQRQREGCIAMLQSSVRVAEEQTRLLTEMNANLKSIASRGGQV